MVGMGNITDLVQAALRAHRPGRVTRVSRNLCPPPFVPGAEIPNMTPLFLGIDPGQLPWANLRERAVLEVLLLPSKGPGKRSRGVAIRVYV